MGLRWEDDLVEGAFPLPLGVAVHVLEGAHFPEVGEHLGVRDANGCDGLAPGGRVVVEPIFGK